MLRERFRYYLDKARRARHSGNLLPRIRRKAFRAIYNPSKDVFDYYLRLSPEDRRIDIDAGFADHRQTANHTPTRPDLQRIVDAYRKSQASYAGAPAYFQVQGLWAEWIAVNYRPLIDALQAADFEKLGRLLANFNREQFATGTGYGYDDCVRYRIPALGRRSILSAWCNYRNILQACGGDPDTARFPMIGNPAGIMRNGAVLPVESLRHACNARNAAGLLRDVPDNVVLEIGGGFGGQAFQTIQAAHPRKYLIFDIPEVAAVCSYFLLAAFPDRKVRLFGEGPVSAADTGDFDIGVFPHYSIARIEDRSVDLVFNESSFSEMDAACSRAYLGVIERVCRKYFQHVNHDVRIEFKNPDGSVSTNCIASDLTPSQCFKRIYKFPRVFGRPEDKLFKSYAFLYERVKCQPSPK